MANCGQMVRDSAMVTMKAYRKPPSLFWMVLLLTPTTFPSPDMGFTNGQHTCKLAVSADTWYRNMIEDERCHLLPNYFGPCYCKSACTRAQKQLVTTFPMDGQSMFL